MEAPQISTDFLGPYVKVERADEHVSNFHSLVEPWLDSDPYRIVRKEDPDTGEEYLEPTVEPPIPVGFGVVVGEVVGLLNSALDQAACSLARRQNSTDCGGLYFPVRKAADEFEAAVKGVEKRLPPAAVDAIRQLDAYKGGHPHIWPVRKLCNIDKHRVVVTTTLVREAWIDIPLPFGGFKIGVGGREPKRVKPGDKCLPPKPIVDDHAKLDNAFEVAIDEPEIFDKPQVVTRFLFEACRSFQGTLKKLDQSTL